MELRLFHMTTESNPYRLARTVVPSAYRIFITPDLESATFAGRVEIDVEITELTSEVRLNAIELDLSAATLTTSGTAHRSIDLRLDEEYEVATYTFDAPLPAGSAVLEIAFSGILNDQLHGFYRSTYTDPTGVKHTIATTQFENTDARRAFPCWDEPAFKATYQVNLTVPSHLAAYSNAPISSNTDLGNGQRTVNFSPTMKMSTYLVAFIIGPFEETEAIDVDGVPLRVVFPIGNAHLTAHALEAGAFALRFFSDYFDIPYPGEKLDMVAIPDFMQGAMENLGCITYRMSDLLIDRAAASLAEMDRVAHVVLHEIAHMWFGDLVTMRWWNGIWLNEAFATLMELLCVDHFRPQWQRWVSFGVTRDAAMVTDGLHATRPVEYPVGPPEEAQGMFDVLTYQKGAGVLRMLERYLGTEHFRAGVRQYLEAHRFGNTETADLWDAIEEASGEPVRDIMDSWILQGGFPLVSLGSADGPTPPAGTVVLSQEPFHYATTEGPSAIGSAWKVPVIARAIDGDEARFLLGSDPEPINLGGESHDNPVVVNAGGSGFYRVRYAPEHHRRLASRLDALDLLERFNLLGDSWAVVVAQRSGPEDFLLLAEALHDEDDPDIWAQVTGALSLVHRAVDDDARPLIASYTCALLGPVLGRLGWEARPGEGPRTPTLRAQVVAALGTVGRDPEVQTQAHRLHDAAQRGEVALDPDLASAILSVVGASGGPEDFETFLEHYRRPTTPQEEMRYLYALTGFADPSLAARAFELAMTEVRSQDSPFVIQLLLNNRDNGPSTWARVVEHWDELVARIPSNILPRMLGGVTSLCRDPQLARDIKAFVHTHPLAIGQRTVDQTLERLEINVSFAASLRETAVPVLSAGLQRLEKR